MIVGEVATGGVVDSSATMICAAPGISETRRLILAGILFVLPPDVAAAVFDEGDIAPINAEERDAGSVVVDWPVSVRGMGDGTLTASCDEAFVTPVSFDRDERLSVVGA